MVGLTSGWLVGWLASRLVGRLASRLVGRLASRLVGWLASRLVGRLASRLVGRLASRLVGWLATWLVGWLQSWLVGWLATELVGWLIGRSVDWFNCVSARVFMCLLCLLVSPALSHVARCSFSPCDQKGERERESVPMEEVLVVNQMTWPELARQCIVANVREIRARGRGGVYSCQCMAVVVCAEGRGEGGG